MIKLPGKTRLIELLIADIGICISHTTGISRFRCLEIVPIVFLCVFLCGRIFHE